MTSPKVRIDKGVAAQPPAPQAPAPGAGPTPSQEVLEAALKHSVVWDGGEVGKGRPITLRRPSVFAGPKVALAVGPEAASNSAFMQMIEPLIYVAQIGEDPVFFPSTMDEVEAIAERLGHEGMQAVNVWYIAHILQPMMDAATQAQKTAQLKNG